MTDPRRKSPMVLPNYPYKGKFTNEQVREALDRKDKLVELLMDPVGPDGTLINLPVDMMHILAFHMAYAGADTHTDSRQLIASRVCRDKSQMFEMYEWRPRAEFGEEQQSEPDVDGEATTIAAQMKTQLTPQVRAALAEILAVEFAAARDATTTRDRAENVLTEQRMKGSQ
jgi:hypothetical protein